MQLHDTILFTNTYGWLGILTGMSLLKLQIICLSSGQFAKIISLPWSSIVGVISVLLKSGWICNFPWQYLGLNQNILLFETVFGLVFYYEEFFTVKFISCSFACSEFLLSNWNVSFWTESNVGYLYVSVCRNLLVYSYL